ncbi:MAG: outer membrane protein assembly factor BamC [Gammaproteobacteria bacterium]|nr:outer membrane protein assembly factor BamC [Gammaproteobacteria bacterium]
MSSSRLSVVNFFVLFVLFFSLAGCSTSEKRSTSQENPTQYNKKLGVDKSTRVKKYIEERQRSSSLSLPPDLLESSNAAILEGYNNSKQLLEKQVLPEIVGARIVSTGDNRWLEIEAPAEEVWKRLADYWASEQVSLSTFKPAAGLMETDWIEDIHGVTGTKKMAMALFNRIVGQGTSHDRYAMRLERASENRTKVFVSHRATVKKEQSGQSPKKLANFDWVQVSDNPEKVAELLQLIILLFDSSRFNDT